MKSLFLLISLTLLSHSTTIAQNEFELEPSQSMLMTGKGDKMVLLIHITEKSVSPL